MTKEYLKSNFILLLAAAIWGFAFVGPFTFNALRFAIGAISLLPLYALTKNKAGNECFHLQKALQSGFFLGLILFIASTSQQF